MENGNEMVRRDEILLVVMKEVDGSGHGRKGREEKETRGKGREGKEGQ